MRWANSFFPKTNSLRLPIWSSCADVPSRTSSIWARTSGREHDISAYGSAHNGLQLRYVPVILHLERDTFIVGDERPRQQVHPIRSTEEVRCGEGLLHEEGADRTVHTQGCPRSGDQIGHHDTYPKYRELEFELKLTHVNGAHGARRPLGRLEMELSTLC